MKMNRKGKWKAALRGKRLFNAALREIADFGSWTHGDKLTWSNLAARLGVSRQALESRPIGEKEVLRDAFWKQKEALQKTEYGTDTEKVVRRTFEERLEASRAEIQRLNKQLDSWVEKWVTVEYNCRSIGLDAEKILTPLLKPNRAGSTSAPGGGGKSM